MIDVDVISMCTSALCVIVSCAQACFCCLFSSFTVLRVLCSLGSTQNPLPLRLRYNYKE
jgi:hypothetical protein